jgi:hypothetical protein
MERTLRSILRDFTQQRSLDLPLHVVPRCERGALVTSRYVNIRTDQIGL